MNVVSLIEPRNTARDLYTRGSFRGSKAKRGEKAQFTRVNEHFESIFLVPRVGKHRYHGKWTRVKVSASLAG